MKRFKPLIFSIFLVLVLAISSTSFAQIASPLITKLPNLGNGSDFTLDESEHFYPWPASNKKNALALWGDSSLSFLKTAAISGTKSGGAANVELISDFFGTVRAALITTIAASDQDSTGINTAQERFFTSGGNVTLSFNQIGPTLRIGHNGFLMTNIVPKISADLPALGSSIDNPSANIDLGLEARLNLPSDNQKIGILASARGAYAFGTERFYSNLDVDKDPFFYFQYNIGLCIPSLKIAVLFSKAVSSSQDLTEYNQNFRLSLCVTN